MIVFRRLRARGFRFGGRFAAFFAFFFMAASYSAGTASIAP